MDFQELALQVENGKAKVVKTMVQEAIDNGVPAKDILDALMAGMDVVGEKFKNNDIFVPDVLMSARAMNFGTELLKPLLVSEDKAVSGKVAIGTIKGDRHDIGKNLVKMMMEGKGLEVVDLGTDVEPAAFVQAVKEQGCNIISCSALLTTTMVQMAEIVDLCKEAGVRDQVKIMIGGAPVTQEFCDQIGADMYTTDAATAADAAVSFWK